jgi:hypothetical protein
MSVGVALSHPRLYKGTLATLLNLGQAHSATYFGVFAPSGTLILAPLRVDLPFPLMAGFPYVKDRSQRLVWDRQGIKPADRISPAGRWSFGP